MSVQDRIGHARAERRLRPMAVGRWAECRGKPIIRVTDARAGDSFRLFSEEAATLLMGGGQLRIGDDVFLNSGVRLECVGGVTIGDHVIVSFGVLISDTDSHGIEGRPVRVAPVSIGSGSWIGARAMVLPGVAIGERCVVAAGAVVVDDVPDDSLVVGNPARLVRTLKYPPRVDRAWS